MVILYSQPTCQPCKAVEARLSHAGITYEKLDVTVDTAAADRIREAGFQSTPVIEYAGEMVDISGLRGILQAVADAA